MNLRKTALWAAAMLVLAGCSDKASDAAQAGAPPAPTETTPATPATSLAAQPQQIAVEVPAPGQVLNDIYGMKGDGSASYTVDNGALATFWYGYRFDLGGKHYYTGFANAGPGKYGKAEESDGPDPGVGVAISQATYVLGDVGGKPAWTLFHAQQWAGDFGANEQADPLDEKREPQRTETKDGHLLLAVPTTRFATGVSSLGLALFSFDPNKNDLGDYKGWVYLGTVATGEDNSAACDDGGTMKCASSTGTLSFEPDQTGAMPTLRVVMKGTAVSGPGKVRVLDASDTVSYTFDASKQQYTPPLDK